MQSSFMGIVFASYIYSDPCLSYNILPASEKNNMCHEVNRTIKRKEHDTLCQYSTAAQQTAGHGWCRWSGRLAKFLTMRRKRTSNASVELTTTLQDLNPPPNEAL